LHGGKGREKEKGEVLEKWNENLNRGGKRGAKLKDKNPKSKGGDTPKKQNQRGNNVKRT